MSPSLLRARRFLPLFTAQALGAFNDNLFKNALVILILLRAGQGGAALVAAAGGIFIFPYVVFSSLAGQLADRFEKPRLIRINKAAEVAIMLAGAAGLLADSIPVLLVALCALGVLATFFSPLKYGILPEHLHKDELMRGNALIEAATFAAILAGTIAGGILIGLPAGPVVVACAVIVVSLLGVPAALAVPPAPAAAPGLRLGLNLAAETLAMLRAARQDKVTWFCILGLSWFWALGAIFLAEFPVMAEATFHGGNQVVTLLLAAFVIGIGAGSMLAAKLNRGAISARFVPVSALLLSVFTFGFAILAASPAAAGWVSPGAMLTSPPGLAAFACLLGASACGGLYSLPLTTLIQHRAAPAERARMIAANNVLNAVFMVLAAVVIAALAAVGVSPATVLSIAAGLNVLAALRLRRFSASATLTLAE